MCMCVRVCSLFYLFTKYKNILFFLRVIDTFLTQKTFSELRKDEEQNEITKQKHCPLNNTGSYPPNTLVHLHGSRITFVDMVNVILNIE